MKFLIFLFSVLFTMNSFGASLSSNNDAQFSLNRAQPGAMQKYQLGTLVVKHQVRVLKAIFDISKSSGQIGTFNLLGEDGQPVVIPNKAVIVGCIIDVQTPATTSASGTIALGTGQAGNDIKTATAAASYTGLVACVPIGTAATSIKITADRTMTYTIATGAITNGKFTVNVQYIIGE